jgi:uncharacterized peroxidase-related enzyme
MAYIDLGSNLPGVTGLLEYRKDTGDLLRELTQILLRGPNSISEAEREMIATVVSQGNQCQYCVTSHAAAVDAYYGGDDSLSSQIREDHNHAAISEKMKALLTIASHVQQSGKAVTQEAISNAKQAGATDREIHDTVMIAALFSFYNRYVDGLGTFAPDDPMYYQAMAIRLKERGYFRPTGGYHEAIPVV